MALRALGQAGACRVRAGEELRRRARLLTRACAARTAPAQSRACTGPHTVQSLHRTRRTNGRGAYGCVEKAIPRTATLQRPRRWQPAGSTRCRDACQGCLKCKDRRCNAGRYVVESRLGGRPSRSADGARTRARRRRTPSAHLGGLSLAGDGAQGPDAEDLALRGLD